MNLNCRKSRTIMNNSLNNEFIVMSLCVGVFNVQCTFTAAECNVCNQKKENAEF